MDLKQAYKLLDADENTTDEELKKSLKKKLAANHPDVNKEPDAEAKFKEVQNAYDLIQKVKNNPMGDFEGFGFGNGFGGGFPGFEFISDLFGRQQNHSKNIQYPTLVLQTELTFIESVIGCDRSFTFDRYEACDKCRGSGQKLNKDFCPKCKGKGKSEQKRGSVFFIEACSECSGTGKKLEKCPDCKGQAATLVSRTVSLTLPGGLNNGQVLQLENLGHFSNRGFYGARQDVAQLKIKIPTHPTMKIKGHNVVSTVSLTLLEALTGTSKEIDTIEGKKKITINPKTKHGDEIKLNKLGVKDGSMTGNHIIDLNITYPKNLDSLIDFLKKETIV